MSVTKVYTPTTSSTKLGILEGMKIYSINPPENYLDLIGELPNDVEILTKTDRKVECVNIFIDQNSDIKSLLTEATKHLFSVGMLWVCFAKDEQEALLEQYIKPVARTLSLKDEKFILLDDYWSGILFKPSR
jgi:hypothetical protein